jgi:hypothetical protein
MTFIVGTFRALLEMISIAVADEYEVGSLSNLLLLVLLASAGPIFCIIIAKTLWPIKQNLVWRLAIVLGFTALGVVLFSFTFGFFGIHRSGRPR